MEDSSRDLLELADCYLGLWAHRTSIMPKLGSHKSFHFILTSVQSWMLARDKRNIVWCAALGALTAHTYCDQHYQQVTEWSGKLSQCDLCSLTIAANQIVQTTYYKCKRKGCSFQVFYISVTLGINLPTAKVLKTLTRQCNKIKLLNAYRGNWL